MLQIFLLLADNEPSLKKRGKKKENSTLRNLNNKFFMTLWNRIKSTYRGKPLGTERTELITLNNNSQTNNT